MLYRQSTENSDVRSRLRTIWTRRLRGCQRSVDVWLRVLKVRALVVPPSEDTAAWIKFANLCRKSQRPALASKTLLSLLNVPSIDAIATDPSVMLAQPGVSYSLLKLQWVNPDLKIRTFEQLQGLVCALKDSLDSKGPSTPVSSSPMTRLLARCYLKLGQWQK